MEFKFTVGELTYTTTESGFVTAGAVRGWDGAVYPDYMSAERARYADAADCRAAGGYSDCCVLFVGDLNLHPALKARITRLQSSAQKAYDTPVFRLTERALNGDSDAICDCAGALHFAQEIT